MKDIFFHSSSVSTWAGYAVTFLLRPFGGLINGGLAKNSPLLEIGLLKPSGFACQMSWEF